MVEIELTCCPVRNTDIENNQGKEMDGGSFAEYGWIIGGGLNFEVLLLLRFGLDEMFGVWAFD